jgi:hypothetical protein
MLLVCPEPFTCQGLPCLVLASQPPGFEPIIMTAHLSSAFSLTLRQPCQTVTSQTPAASACSKLITCKAKQSCSRQALCHHAHRQHGQDGAGVPCAEWALLDGYRVGIAEVPRLTVCRLLDMNKRCLQCRCICSSQETGVTPRADAPGAANIERKPDHGRPLLKSCY